MGLKLNNMATESISIIIGNLIVQKRGNAAIQSHKQQGRRPQETQRQKDLMERRTLSESAEETANITRS